MAQCPMCENVVRDHREWENSRRVNYHNCPNCGKFELTQRAAAAIGNLDVNARAALSHAVWQNQDSPGVFVIETSHVAAASKHVLADPAELLDRLILYVGKNQSSPGKLVNILEKRMRAKLGAADHQTVTFIRQAAIDQGLLQLGPNISTVEAFLSMLGWQRYHELQRGAVHSKHAFIAMPFGEADVTAIVESVFRPAVEEVGFKLRRMDDAPRAGVIDDRMRVEIRQCKFLLADLTHANNGAYWEAGFAEGLGKPVIYTCEKDFFKKQKTHFDTNHCTTILWDHADPVRTAEDLKATIRNTFPFEAKMPPESID